MKPRRRASPAARRSFLIALLLAVVAPLVGLTVLAAPASADPMNRADVSDFTFSSFDGNYTLTRGSDGIAQLRAVETFVAEFPAFDQNKGIIRAIPDVFDGAPLHTGIVSVTDAQGEDVAWEADREGDFLELALGTDDYVQGTQSYVITYTQSGVVGAYRDTRSDEFYWDAPGTGWDQPFADARMTVRVDAAVADALTGNGACYRGDPDDSSPCDLAQSEAPAGDVFTTASVPLGARQTLTVAIGFEPGTFATPARPGEAPVFSIVPIVLGALSAVGVGVLVWIRARLWRNHAGRGIIVPQYTVPKDLTLLLAGDLISRPGTSMAAQIVSLAVRGKLRIIDGPGKDFSLQYLDDSATDEQERRVLAMLFPDRSVPREMKQVDAELGKAVTAELQATKRIALDRGFRRTVSSAAAWIVVGALAVVGVSAFVFFGFAYGLRADNGWSLSALLLCGIAVLAGIVLAIAPKPLTAAGADELDSLLGLRMYLQLAEADRFRMLQSPAGAERVDLGDPGQLVRLTERLLPFAVLWGVEREWSRELGVRYEQAGTSPNWYASDVPFQAALFSNAFTGFTGSATSTSASWSTSGGASTSGGSTGGGFAGGGGGGGGGGGR
ncbi:DUF2207 domain-containing protein [Plantibacter flavus]|uniref:DUF2207 domain-containing protein n=1 Tax=Plantibacter flavus TaxID=150123 RepID=UPI003F148AD4